MYTSVHLLPAMNVVIHSLQFHGFTRNMLHFNSLYIDNAFRFGTKMCNFILSSYFVIVYIYMHIPNAIKLLNIPDSFATYLFDRLFKQLDKLRVEYSKNMKCKITQTFSTYLTILQLCKLIHTIV